MREVDYSLDPLLRPFKISPHLLGRLLPFGKSSSRALEPALSKRLQFFQFALFGVQFARSVFPSLSALTIQPELPRDRAAEAEMSRMETEAAKLTPAPASQSPDPAARP